MACMDNWKCYNVNDILKKEGSNIFEEIHSFARYNTEIGGEIKGCDVWNLHIERRERLREVIERLLNENSKIR